MKDRCLCLIFFKIFISNNNDEKRSFIRLISWEKLAIKWMNNCRWEFAYFFSSQMIDISNLDKQYSINRSQILSSNHHITLLFIDCASFFLVIFIRMIDFCCSPHARLMVLVQSIFVFFFLVVFLFIFQYIYSNLNLILPLSRIERWSFVT